MLSAIAFSTVLGMGRQVAAQPILFGAAQQGGGSSILYTVDPTTGAENVVGPIGFNRCSGMDFHPVTEILYATCERNDGEHVLITIDSLTGAGTEVGPTGVRFLPGPLQGCCDTASDISFRNSDNVLFSYTFPGDGLATIDLVTGAMTSVGTDSGVGIEGNAIAFSSGDTLFKGDADGLSILDQAAPTGAGTFVFFPLDYPDLPVTQNFPRPNGMDFDPLTEKLYASVVNGGGGFISPPKRNFLGIIDTQTGIVTIIGETVSGLDALAWSPALEEPIPVADHFLSYQIKHRAEVFLEDPFMNMNGVFEIKDPVALLNPADKDGGGINDRNTHLLSYKVEGPDFAGFEDISVINQFGEFFVGVEEPERLLVPASKSLSSDGPLPSPDTSAHNVDHFLCYEIDNDDQDNLGIQIPVVDQFNQPKLFDIKKPRWLCNPVEKNGEEIKDPDNHLMCFSIEPASGEPSHDRIEGLFVNDQFGPGRADTKIERELCVPSTKSGGTFPP